MLPNEDKEVEPFFSPGDGTDIGYVNVRDSDDLPCADGRKFTEHLWPRFAPYADSLFLNEAKSNFTERFWEMYLGCTLLDCGLQIGTPGDEGPDLFAKIRRRTFWFEATAPSGGAGADQVPGPTERMLRPVPEEQIILRLTAAIDAKRVHFERSRDAEIVADRDGAIICINGRKIPSSITDHRPHRIVKAVFPIGNLTYTLDRRTQKIIDSAFEFRPHIAKASGTEILTTGFLDDDLAMISAVIYSRVDCANHPKRLGDDFVCVHNPKASNPLPIGFLSRGIEYWAEGDTLRWLEHNIKRNVLARCGHRLKTLWARLRYVCLRKRVANVEP